VTKVTNGPQKLYTIKYTDGTTMDAEEHEARRWLRASTTLTTGSSTATSPWAPSITYLEKTA
jgi:hypothetical protein